MFKPAGEAPLSFLVYARQGRMFYYIWRIPLVTVAWPQKGISIAPARYRILRPILYVDGFADVAFYVVILVRKDRACCQRERQSGSQVLHGFFPCEFNPLVKPSSR